MRSARSGAVRITLAAGVACSGTAVSAVAWAQVLEGTAATSVGVAQKGRGGIGVAGPGGFGTLNLNPALVIGTHGFAVATSTGSRAAGVRTLAAELALNLGNAGTLGIEFGSAWVDELFEESGDPALSDLEARDSRLTLVWARDLTSWASIGGAAQLVQSRIFATAGHGLAWHVGARVNAGERLFAGVAATSLGSGYRWSLPDGSSERTPFASELRVGIGAQVPVSVLTVLPALDLAWSEDGEQGMGVGLELRTGEALAFRGGLPVRRGGSIRTRSFGVGLDYWRVGLDFARTVPFESEPFAEWTSIGLRFRF